MANVDLLRQVETRTFESQEVRDWQKNLLRYKNFLIYPVLIILLTTFLVTVWPNLLENHNIGKTDQRTYLLLGLELKNDVRLTDGNSHFLFPLILSAFSSKDWPYFTSAKLLNIAFGLSLLLIIFLLNKKLFNLEVALLATALTALNPDVLDVFTKVIPDPLLTILFTLAISFWYVGCEKGKIKFFILAGLAAGLAYLTKGTGQLLLLCFIGWIMVSARWINAPFYSFIYFTTAYFAITSPLLIYNAYGWGNPFYNFNSSQAMWYDKWEDVYLLPVEQGSLGYYFASHSLADIVNRFISGGIFIIQERGDVLFPVYTIVLMLSACLIYIFKLLSKKGTHLFFPKTDTLKPIIVIPLVILAVWFIFFAWYAPISNSNRHFIAILPLVNTTISIAFINSMSILSFRSESMQAYVLPVLCLFIAIFSLYRITGIFMTLNNLDQTWNVYQSDIQKNSELDELLGGLESSEKTVTVISGPSQLIPLWRTKAYNLNVNEIPMGYDSIEELQMFMESVNADYLIIDTQTITRRLFLSDYFDLKEADNIYSDFEITTPLPGLSLMAHYRVDRTPIMIFVPQTSE